MTQKTPTGRHAATYPVETQVPVAFHALAAAWVIGVFILEKAAPGWYSVLMQEDRPVEWATVALFLVAGVRRARGALRSRLAFDSLVALFCLFVAGEEMSWGQRLLGFAAPAQFLEHNTQQELNVHNFAEVFGRPKWTLIAALAGYGLLLPALARVNATARALRVAGATPPPLALAFWFALAVALLVIYPLEFTGEWVELLAGALFLVATPGTRRAMWLGLGAAAPVGIAMTYVSEIAGRGGGRDEAMTACAGAETRALVAEVRAGGKLEPATQPRSVHRRVWSLVSDWDVQQAPEQVLGNVDCDSGIEHGPRRRYAIDPWGTAYWLRNYRADDGERWVIVYSFGPNRRRDEIRDDVLGGDDIEARRMLER